MAAGPLRVVVVLRVAGFLEPRRIVLLLVWGRRVGVLSLPNQLSSQEFLNFLYSAGPSSEPPAKRANPASETPKSCTAFGNTHQFYKEGILKILSYLSSCRLSIKIKIFKLIFNVFFYFLLTYYVSQHIQYPHKISDHWIILHKSLCKLGGAECFMQYIFTKIFRSVA